MVRKRKTVGRESLKQRIYRFVEPGASTHPIDVLFDRVIIILIILSVLSIFLESFASINLRYLHVFIAFYFFTIIVFGIEYILRVWVADIKTGIPGWRGRLKYMVQPLAIIDLIVVISPLMPFLATFDLRFLRLLRMMKLFTVFKFQRYTENMHLFSGVIKKKREELAVATFIFVMFIIISAAALYHVESSANPPTFSNMLVAAEWVVSTMVNTRYGGTVPVTIEGRLLGNVVGLLGIALFAVLTSIITSGFIEYADERKRDQKKK